MMNKQIRRMIDEIFADMKMTADNLALRDEMMANAQARFEDSVRAGKTEEEAFAEVAASLGDVQSLLHDMNAEKSGEDKEDKKDKEEKYNKIVILLKENSKKKYYQIEKYTDKQVFHENIELNMLEEKILEFMESKYKQLSAWATDMNFDLKISKKNKVFLGKKKSNNSNIITKGHNKEKNYILKEGTIIQPLIDLGVFTKEGKVVNSQYDKYKQINRFIEIIDDEVKKNNFEELTVLDFGCGKSYLTFVLYYYFTEIKKINVKMIGLDLKADVIKKCNDIAKKYNYENLINDINNLDLVAHRHSLVIIKNKDKYLLYDDERWQCKLFINYKTKDENNETAIKEALEKDLQLDTSTINCEFVTSRTQEKYSVSHNENRIYNHNLYSITLSKLPAYMKKDNFVINNKHYYWMTMDEMLSDSNIKEKNLEVVYFVKDSIS